MTCVCGYKKSEHLKVVIRENGLGSKVVGKKLKCPKRLGVYKESK